FTFKHASRWFTLCHASSILRDCIYFRWVSDATAAGHKGGACWLLDGNVTEVLNPLATSGPKVCPAGSSERVKVMSNVVNSVLAPTVAPTKVDVPTSALSVDTSTAAPAKEAFTNSAGAGAKSTVSEHAVGAVPVMVGQVVAPVLDCDWRRRPFVGTWMFVAVGFCFQLTQGGPTLAVIVCRYRPPDELPSAALPVIVPEHLKVLSLPSNPALQCLFTGSLNMPSVGRSASFEEGPVDSSARARARIAFTECKAIPESQWAGSPGQLSAFERKTPEAACNSTHPELPKEAIEPGPPTVKMAPTVLFTCCIYDHALAVSTERSESRSPRCSLRDRGEDEGLAGLWGDSWFQALLKALRV
ncbi:unnamed protein product, partial [Symbiodinium necroappetens]